MGDTATLHRAMKILADQYASRAGIGIGILMACVGLSMCLWAVWDRPRKGKGR